MSTQISILDALKYSQLQMAAEAFLREGNTLHGGDQALQAALIRGNDRSSKFTEVQAAAFAAEWEAVDQKENTSTGFSGTLFKNKVTNEYVISLRSTEFLDDAARDNQATNQMEIAKYGFAFGQLRDMEDWYADLRKPGGLLGPAASVDVTGYSLGGHLATAFNLLHQGDGNVGKVVTFNGAGIGRWAEGSSLPSLLATSPARRTRSSRAMHSMAEISTTPTTPCSR